MKTACHTNCAFRYDMELVRLRILFRAATATVVMTCLCAAKLQASDFRALLLDGNYSKPLRLNVGASLFFSHDDVKNSSEGGSGIIVGGGAGRGGMQVW